MSVNNLLNLSAQESNLTLFVINGSKVKIAYENKRPLGKTYEKIWFCAQDRRNKISKKGNGASNMNFFCTEKHTEYFKFLKTVS